jgi:hypothetical protein
LRRQAPHALRGDATKIWIDHADKPPAKYPVLCQVVSKGSFARELYGRGTPFEKPRIETDQACRTPVLTACALSYAVPDFDTERIVMDGRTKRGLPIAPRHWVLVWWVMTPALAHSAPPTLSLPIDCEIGKGCEVQNYVDHTRGAAASDFACGGRTNDGHKGTDFRIRDAAAMLNGVTVLAGADGVVKAIRDDMADTSIRNAGASGVSGRECGNGVVLEHGDGWITQYCHLRRGSVRAKPGETVARGDVLGQVGLSGLTEFAHLHFEIRKDGVVVDPFNGGRIGEAAGPRCERLDDDGALWDARTRAVLAYRPVAFLSGGFAGGPVTLDTVERAPPSAPTSASPALVAYVRVLGVRAGDLETLTLTDPDGGAFGTKGPATIPAPKAQWLTFFGRKRKSPSWPLGLYNASYRLERDGRVLLEERFSIDLK